MPIQPVERELQASVSRPQNEFLVIGASSAGTMFEWYDFFLYGALAANIAAHFFSAVDETTAFIFALAAFASGFLVRPFGALVFGRIGDVVGRKNTFLVTMAIMGVATFLVGLLPSYEQIGIAAPLLLVGLRLLQGLAIGGEYGGAAIYVAEHAPPGKRGLHTSWINATATAGLLLSLIIIMASRSALSPEAFKEWGWRIPFLFSIFLLGISLWIRMKLSESPVFQRMKAEATTSKAPLAEAFGRWSNVKLVLIALFGTLAGGTCIWYAGHFYSLFFLERVLKVDGLIANQLMTFALVLAAPSYLFFGWLSDKIGRRPVVLSGLALGALTIWPLFHLLTAAANPALARAQESAPVTVHADPANCSFQFDLLGRNKFDASACDIAKSFLTRAGISYTSEPSSIPGRVEVRVGSATLTAPDPGDLTAETKTQAIEAFRANVRARLDEAGYPAAADPNAINKTAVVLIIAFLVMLSAMAYAPLAALLVELFPARIRYTSLSLPYHIGAGWIGGFLPTTAFAIVAATGNMYAGLIYPIAFATITLVVGILTVPETYKRSIDG